MPEKLDKVFTQKENKGSMRDRDRKIGIAIKRAYEELEAKREDAHFDDKLLACAFVHHRDCYSGTRVPVETRVYTSTPQVFVEKYVKGVTGYLMPQSQQWASWAPAVGVGGAKRTDGQTMILDKRIATTIEALNNITFTALAQSNFYSEVYQAIMDWAVIGTGCLQTIDRGTPIPSFRSEDPQAFVIDDNEYREVDCYIRKFTMNAVSCVRAYPKAELAVTRQMYKTGSHQSMQDVRLYEAIFERGYLIDFEEGEPFKFKGTKNYVSIIFSDTDTEILSEGCYEEFPLAFPVRGRDSEKCFWGHGLVEDCLPDIIQLNDAVNNKQIALQKLVSPPMAVPYSMEGAYSERPKKINYTPDINQRPVPIQEITDYTAIAQDVQMREENLKYKMDVILFETVMSSGDSRKTATEVTMQENKAILLLALNIDNLLKDLITPTLRRTIKIAVRNADLSANEERGQRIDKNALMAFVDSLHIELNSVFVKRLNAYMQAEGIVNSAQYLQVAATFMPESLQVIDGDTYIKAMLASQGLPSTFFKSDEEVKKQREAMAQLQQQQLEAEQQMQQAKAASNSANAYAKLSGAGMSMDQLMGGGQSGEGSGVSDEEAAEQGQRRRV